MPRRQRPRSWEAWSWTPAGSGRAVIVTLHCPPAAVSLNLGLWRALSVGQRPGCRSTGGRELQRWQCLVIRPEAVLVEIY